MMLQADACVRLENYTDQIKTAGAFPGFFLLQIQGRRFHNAFAFGLVEGVQWVKSSAGRFSAAFYLHKYQSRSVGGYDVQFQMPGSPVALHNAQATGL